MRNLTLTLITLFLLNITGNAQDRKRVRHLGIQPGILQPGPLNAITDVQGVKVGHKTLTSGSHIRTGVTIVFPHGRNIYKEPVPAAVFVGNGFGKAVGLSQIRELGEIETPIGLTNTLSIHTVANAITDYTLQLPGNEQVRSVNPVVGETNDGWLNDIRGRYIEMNHVYEAIAHASSGVVPEGSVGAGTGTSALGFKGGIGTASRKLPEKYGSYTVGVLVQSNFGGILTVGGAPVGEELGNHYLSDEIPHDVDGSVMIIVATDAPLSSRNLERLAKRAFLGVARVGGFASNGSGDYVIAFSNNIPVKDSTYHEKATQSKTLLKNKAMTPLFLAAVEATEEAILNSLFMATTVRGRFGRTQKALPIYKVKKLLNKHNLLDKD